MTRRILRSIRLDKIAAVDRPCQEHATVAILKRAPEDIGVLADQISKNLIMLPISNGSSDSFDFNFALEEAMECEAWCGAKEELRPYVCSLRDSLISIYKDPKIDQSTRALKIRNVVGQFLDSIQQKFAEDVPVIEQAVAAKRLRDIQKRLLLAKSGVALLSTLLITKEFDESKHPRDDRGRFGEGGGGGIDISVVHPSSDSFYSNTKGEAKSAGHSKILRVLQFAAGLGVAYNVAEVATVIAGFFGLGFGAAAAGAGAGVLIGSMALAAAAPFVLGAAGLEITRRALRGLNKSESASKSSWKQVNQQIARLSPKQAKEFNEKFMDALSPEQADAVAAKMREIVSQAKTKLQSKFGVKKHWSDEARQAAVESRKRALSHRDKAESHRKEGRSITALKHEVVADHYEEAAEHYGSGRMQRGHDVRSNGEAILGIHKSAEIKKVADKRRRLRKLRPFPPDTGRRRGKQGSLKSRKLSIGTQFGLQKIAEVIAKSSIVLAAIPDPVSHVRKVIGDTAADYIKDFVESTNPKFKGKSKQERIRQALGAYYSNK